MIVGFSGSERLITGKQQWSVAEILAGFYDEGGINRFHHGCCIVSDDKCARIAKLLGYELHGHPPIDRKKVPLKPVVNDVEYPPLPYLKRNIQIAHCAQVFVSTPLEFKEVLRSGTWSTLRHANRLHRPGLVVWRNGEVDQLDKCLGRY